MANTPAIWRLALFIALQPWRIVWLALYSMLVFLRNIAWNIGPMLPVYFLVLILLGLSAATYPITANQEPILEFLVQTTKNIETAWNTVAAILRQILDCKEIVVELWNTWMNLIASILKRVFNAVNNVLGLGLPPLFDWAERSYLLERDLERLEKQHVLRRTIDEYMATANATLAQIDPRYHHHYLSAMQTRILRTAARRAGIPSQRIAILPDELCEVLQEMFSFIIGLLDIFSDYFLFFLDLLLSFFDIVNGDFTQSFLFVLVQTLIIEVLQQLPFTDCFIDPDALDSGDLGDIADAFRAQVAQRLLSCLCPWRYKNPIGFPPFLSPTSGGDDVPSNPGVAIFGCLCFNPTISLTTNTSIEDLFIKCLGIDVLINQFQNFLNTLQNTFQPLYNWLVGVYYSLLSAFNGLRAAFNDLKRLFDRLDDLLPRRRDLADPERAALDESVRQLDEAESDLRRLNLAFEFQRELHKQFTNQTYVQEMYERPGMRQLQTVVGLAFKAHANGERIRRAVVEDAPGLFARVLDKLPDSDAFKQFYKRLEEKRGAGRAEHVQAFRRGLEQILGVVRGHFRARFARAELDARMDEIDMEPFVRSVFALSGRGDRLRAPPGLRSLDAAGTILIGSMFGPASLQRAVRRLEERYGDDPAARDGVRYGARLAHRRDGMEDVLRRYNLTEADIREVHREVKAELKEVRETNRRDMALLADIRNYAAAEFHQYVDGVHYAYYDYSAAHMTGRVVVVAIALVGGAAATAVTVAGFAVGAALTALGTLLVGLLAPLLLFAVVFFQYTLSLVSHIASGIIINALPTSSDTPFMFDILTPYIQALQGPLRRSFFFGFTFSDVIDLALDFGEITGKHLEYVGAWTLAYSTGKWPLPLGKYIKARDPRVNEDAKMDESFLEYVIDGIFFCPQGDACLDDGDCGGADCVCPENPSRLGTERPARPCNTGLGVCRCWPFVQERIGVQDYQVDLNLDPPCDIAYEFDPSDVSIYLDPVFQEKGWSLAFVLTRNFWDFSLKFLRVGLSFVRFTVRRAVLGGFVKWNTVFVPLAGTLFFLPSGPLRLIAIVALAANTLTSTVRETALFFIDVFDQNKDLPIVGVVFEYLLTWMRFPNYATFPPFGEPAANDWICLVLNISSVFYILAILLLTLIIVSGLLLSGAVGLAVAVFVDLVLLPLNLVYFIVRSFVATSLMYNTGLLTRGRLRTQAGAERAPIYRYTAKPAGAAPGRLMVGSPLARAGVLSTAGAVDAGGVAFLCAGKRGRGEPWWRAAGYATLGLLLGAWRWVTVGWRDAWRHGPLRVRPRGEGDAASTCVVYTADVPAEHRAGFPMDMYITLHTGESIHEARHVVPVDARMVHSAWSDEALAVYHAPDAERPPKTTKIN